jgi:tRNA threonylcarbamoyladenosine biosynthesis protein TsaE
MLVITTDSPEATFALGRKIAAKLVAGDVLCLSGDLGAGKTLFVQGLADGLGVRDTVNSPTFTILQVYATGRLPLYHFDLYRLDSPEELSNIGFEEYLDTDGVTAIEWADKFLPAMPEEALGIELKIAGYDAAKRVITIKPCGGERCIQLYGELKGIADTCP